MIDISIIVETLGKLLSKEKLEHIYCSFIDREGNLISINRVSEFSISNKTFFSPLTILSNPYSDKSAGIILTHNHPSATPEPSFEDIYSTNSIKKLIGLFGLQLIDHIIVSKTNGFYSMARAGLIEESFLDTTENECINLAKFHGKIDSIEDAFLLSDILFEPNKQLSSNHEILVYLDDNNYIIGYVYDKNIRSFSTKSILKKALDLKSKRYFILKKVDASNNLNKTNLDRVRTLKDCSPMFDLYLNDYIIIYNSKIFSLTNNNII